LDGDEVAQRLYDARLYDAADANQSLVSHFQVWTVEVSCVPNSHSTISMIITNGTGDVGQDTSNIVDEDVEELDESRCFRFRL
jgi:hypothetical protein